MEKCIRCLASTGMPTNAKVQEERVQIVQRTTCQYCTFKSCSLSGKISHEKRHTITGEERFSCQYCPFKSYDLSKKDSHEKRHLLCTAETATKEIAKFKVTIPSAKKVCEESPCKVCGKLVKHLNSHMKIHSKGKTFDCETCSQKFCTLATMKRHTSMVHLQIKPYSCKVCSKSFALKFQLKDHEEMHNGELPCEQCDKTFPSTNYLKSHIRNKHMPKVLMTPARCEICKKTLYDAKTLTRHNRLLHSTKRPFSCKFCPRSYALRSMMNSHVRATHTRENSLKCN